VVTGSDTSWNVGCGGKQQEQETLLVHLAELCCSNCGCECAGLAGPIGLAADTAVESVAAAMSATHVEPLVEVDAPTLLSDTRQ